MDEEEIPDVILFGLREGSEKIETLVKYMYRSCGGEIELCCPGGGKRCYAFFYLKGTWTEQDRQEAETTIYSMSSVLL